MLVEVTDAQIRTMVEVLVNKHIAPDLEDVFGERKTITNPPRTTGGSFASLADLYKDLATQEMGASNISQIKKDSVETYLDSRNRFLEGFRDEYDRPGYIQTIPSEVDSASASLVHDFECPEQDLVSEGPLFKTYRAKHKLGRFGIWRAISTWQPETEKNFDESEVLEGVKIVVPSSPYAGYYTSLFVPDNKGRSYAWAYTEKGKPNDEDFLHQVQSTYMEMFTQRSAQTSDLALLYTIKVFSKMNHVNYPRMVTLLQNQIGKFEMENTEGELINKVLEAAESYPNQFTPSVQPHFDTLREIQAHLQEEDPVKRATMLLLAQDMDRDPGLLIASLDTLTEEEAYRKFIQLTYGTLNQQFQILEGIAELDLDNIREYAERHQAYRAFHNIHLPWQAEIVLGNEKFRDLSQRMKALDPVSQSFGFSLLHPQLKYLPPEAVEKTAYVTRPFKMVMDGEESPEYFDLERFEEACYREAYTKDKNYIPIDQILSSSDEDLFPSI